MVRRTFLLLSSFLLFTTLAVAGKSIENNQSKISVNVNSNNLSTEVLSETDEAGSASTPTASSTSTPTIEKTENTDEEEEVTTTPTSTSTTAVIGFAVDSYIYPGSAVISKSANYLELSTSTDTKTVTDWYEKKIRENGFNVKSFVRTNTNNVVKNVIAAANANEELKIEIVNQSSGTLTRINFF